MTNILIVGFGASSLNIRALTCVLAKPIHYLDTLDPIAVENILAPLDLSQITTYIISKSGATNETNLLTEFLIKKGLKNPYVLCENKSSKLHDIVSQISHTWIPYAEAISGRFAILTKPFLDIAKLAGVDTVKLQNGAASMNHEDAEEMATRWLHQFELGATNWVVILYSRRLYGIFLWVRQIVAESLGKEGFGILPVLAEGTMDEHSQLQLFLGGPNDKFYDILSCESTHELGKAQAAHAHKVRDMLKNKDRYVTHTHFECIDEAVVGRYIVTIISAIEIVARHKGFDAYNQPEVESLKNKTR